MKQELPAVRYTMGGRVFYDSSVEWGGLHKLVDMDAIGGPEQRPLDKRHAKDIQYYVESEPQPVFPAILAFVSEEDFQFTPFPGRDDVGLITVSSELSVKAGDGQHRVRALTDVSRANPDFRSNQIGITFLVESRIEKQRQDWVDINDNVKAPNKAVAMVFDERSPLVRVYARVSREVELFTGGELGFVEDRRNSPARNSVQLFAANNVGQALSAFILCSTRKGKGAAEKELSVRLKTDDNVAHYCGELVRYFKAVQDGIPALKDLIVAGDRRTAEEVQKVREDYVFASGLGLNLLGLLGGQAAKRGENLEWFGRQLGTLDWSRSNSFWHGHMIAPRTLAKDDGTTEVSYGVGRGGDIVEEAARRVREKIGTPLAAAV